MNPIGKIAGVLALVVLGISSASAAVSAEEASQLGGPVLTALGAEKAGNAEGTIPPYTGTGPVTPPGWVADGTIKHRPDPYGEKPLYSITAQNVAQYADKLDGMVEIFKRYPDYRMDIYPTHRDYRVPKFVEENTIKNATACKAVNDELKIESCYRGLPFPIPKSGNQAMWNHLQGYQALAFHGRAEVWVTPVSGPAVMVTRVNHINDYHYYNPDLPSLAGPEELFLRYLGKDEAPARLAGSQFMMLDPVDQFTLGRRAYFYTAGRRWVKLAANLAYDTPTPYGAGSATMDDSQSFLGALDRFDFALGGKKEKFIYYNNFSFSDPQTCPPEKIVSTHGFPNPDCVRWELHRVWVVKATLKPGKSHLYHKRIFYWDEDGYVAGASESYNANGKLFRFANNILLPFFEAPGAQGAGNVYLDIDSGITVHTAILSGPGGGLEVITTPLPDDMFRPDAMAGAGIR